MSAGFQKLASKIDAANRDAAQCILANVPKYGEGSVMVIWARAIMGGSVPKVKGIYETLYCK